MAHSGSQVGLATSTFGSMSSEYVKWWLLIQASVISPHSWTSGSSAATSLFSSLMTMMVKASFLTW